MTKIFLKDFFSHITLIMICWLGTVVVLQVNSNIFFLSICFLFFYILGIILIPESSFYQFLQKEKLEEEEKKKRKEKEEYISLKLKRYSEKDESSELIDLCNKLKNNLKDNVLRSKVDETLDIYLNIIEIQVNCIEFVKSENKKTIEKKIEVNELRLSKENDLRSKESIENILKSLRQRLKKREEVDINVKRIELEKERLIEQIKLLYAESLTNTNSNMLAIKMESNFRMIDQIKIFTLDLGNRLNL